MCAVTEIAYIEIIREGYIVEIIENNSNFCRFQIYFIDSSQLKIIL